MRAIVKWWASNTVAANLMMLILLVGGLVSFIQIERETVPYVEIPGAQVVVAWPGASPQDVEEQIVVRMEEAFTHRPKAMWTKTRSFRISSAKWIVSILSRQPLRNRSLESFRAIMK